MTILNKSTIKTFTFNPFSENTFVVYDDSKECVIIDPGCYSQQEKNELRSFIENENLKPVLLLNTHCHIDHVMGNKFISETYGLKAQQHKLELPVLQSVVQLAEFWGLTVEEPPAPGKFFDEGETIRFGNTSFEIYFTPGHSPGHVVFYNAEDGYTISGDVLFQQSIGRTDLPGGDYDTLINSIKNKMFKLPDNTVVYPGHGPQTTIGIEKKSNPFLN